ncbi:MAG TPA: hypothetical protein VMZ29_00405 [Candidatus Bathyarchaeia archaeon]|nr:hypothetical protein [Candidatus Bathyarchaeia archaeon]
MVRKIINAKKYFMFLFLILLLLFCSTSNLRVKAETEPNDDFAHANLPENGHLIGWSTISNPDYWKVECAANSFIYIVYTGVYENAFGIEAYDPNFNQICDEGFPPNELNISASQEGWYYLIVRTGIPLAGADYDFTIDYYPVTELEWLEPDSGYIEFGPDPDDETAVFDFSFEQKGLQTVELFINDTFYYEFSDLVLINNVSVPIPYNETIDGFVEAELVGYFKGEAVISAERYFTFAKLIFIGYEILNQGVGYLGNKLYSILYDPNGDNSYSGWEDGSTFSMGVGASLAIGVGVNIGVEFNASLCSGEANLEMKVTEESGYDFRYETTELAEITSAQSEDDPEAIGPGFGDYFWGEVWTIPWKLESYHLEYWNGTTSYFNNSISYGINRTATILLIAGEAPEEWLALSLYPNYPSENVTWLGTKVVSGGGGESTDSQEIVSTEAIHHSIPIDIGTEASAKIGSVTATLTLNLQTKVYKEVSSAFSIMRYYHIMDDDVNDIIVNDYGFDRRFGTFVFRTTDSCLTSNPLEHNTVDYLKPIIYTPAINYDSSADDLFPCEDDEPIVVVEIEDEGGIQNAWINYTINDGLSWSKVDLIEQSGNPGFWEGQIPSQEHGTVVKWFIEAEDNANQKSVKKNPHGNPFSYTVINRPPIIDIIAPNGGESHSGDEIIINWSSSDLDDDELTYSIAYNLNNQGWQSLILDLTEDSYIWDITNFGIVDSVLIRVTAYDNFGGVASDTSDLIFSINRTQTEATGFYIPSLMIFSVLLFVLTVKIIKKRR